MYKSYHTIKYILVIRVTYETKKSEGWKNKNKNKNVVLVNNTRSIETSETCLFPICFISKACGYDPWF